MEQQYFPKNIFTRVVVLSMLWALIPLSAGATASAQIRLNNYVEVETDFITLGDVFSGLVENQDHIIAPAPLPGNDLVLNAATLGKIARSFRLDWKPQANFVDARIIRSAHPLARKNIEDRILEAASAQLSPISAGQKWQVVMENAPQRFYVPSEQQSQIEVKSLRYDTLSKRFQADISLYKGATPFRLRGELVTMIDVPVPLHSIDKLATIRKDDLHLVQMRKDKLAPNIQTDINKIVGKAPKRLLRADSPIVLQYLSEPTLVKNKSLVSIIYSAKNLTLVTKGMALESGSLGQVIRVKNLKSNRVVDTVITGTDEVSVSFSAGNVALGEN